jgi:antirestriction protein ArdC
MKHKQDTRKTNIKILSAQVNAIIESTMDSERFKSYIRTIALFHKYSWQNQILIASQKPEAIRVAGYRAWQKKFNRHVVKGAKAISIFGHPTVYENEIESDDGKTDIQKHIHWPIVKVFDISDTEGEDLPMLDLRKVEDNSEQANDLFELLKIKIISSGVDLEEVPEIEGSKASGAFNTKKNEIQIVTRSDISRGELFKTLAHEYGHALYENLFSRKHEDHSYAFEECVVESSAMIVACKFGLDIAPYDASYVASWSKGDKEMYKNGLSKASALAKNIIESMEVPIEC